jgi:hypothetical protein
MQATLTNLILKSGILCDDCGHYGAAYCAEALASHLTDAGAILTPCKIGQIGYWVTSYGIMPVTFDRIYLSAGNEWRIRMRYQCTETRYIPIDAIGSTVFLDLKEAEEAQARRNR